MTVLLYRAAEKLSSPVYYFGMIVADGKTKEILADAKLLEAHGLEKP